MLLEVEAIEICLEGYVQCSELGQDADMSPVRAVSAGNLVAGMGVDPGYLVESARGKESGLLLLEMGSQSLLYG